APGEERGFRADVNESPHPGPLRDLEKLLGSRDVGLPEFRARAPLLHEGGAVDDRFDVLEMLRRHLAELTADRRNADAHERMVAWDGGRNRGDEVRSGQATRDGAADETGRSGDENAHVGVPPPRLSALGCRSIAARR